jgi:hypothetical protein
MVPFAVLCGVMMAFLARVGLVGQVGPPTPERPNSCSLYDAEQKKCASGSRDAGTVERLKGECLRDGGRP